MMPACLLSRGSSVFAASNCNFMGVTMKPSQGQATGACALRGKMIFYLLRLQPTGPSRFGKAWHVPSSGRHFAPIWGPMLQAQQLIKSYNTVKSYNPVKP